MMVENNWWVLAIEYKFTPTRGNEISECDILESVSRVFQMLKRFEGIQITELKSITGKFWHQ